MQINSIGSVGALQKAAPTNVTKSTASVADPAPSQSIVDQLDFSPEAQSLLSAQSAQASGDIRSDKVDSIRQAIANGTYETPEKLSQALDKLLDSLA